MIEFKNQLILKEYGRNIQKLVEYVKNIPDREKRTQNAYTLVELMKQISPNIKESSENSQKLWDDLYIMANFNLDIDSPFPMPEKSLLGKKPKRLAYTPKELIFKHYGRNIELLVEKAVGMEDEEEQEAAIIFIGKLMKTYYSAWNKENVDDDVIIENINHLAKGKLNINRDKIKEGSLFDVAKEKDRERDMRENRGEREMREPRMEGMRDRDRNGRGPVNKLKRGIPNNKRRK